MILDKIVLDIDRITIFLPKYFHFKTEELNYEEMKNIYDILVHEINNLQTVISYFLVSCLIVLTGIIIYLVWANFYLQRRLRDANEEIKDAHLEISKRKKISHKVIECTDKVKEKRLFGSKEYILFGYRIQYFMDDILFVSSPFTAVDRCRASDVDSDKIEELTKKALQAGTQAVTTFTARGNPLEPVATNIAIRELLSPSSD